MEEPGKEVLSLTQRLALHCTEALHSLNQSSELLREGERRKSSTAFR
jgi:hypothetical protein